MNWQDKPQVKKGNVGEELIRKYLEKNGWIIYEPITEGAHAFDKLCVKDKKFLVIAEVKTKARLNKLNATGFDVKHYNDYCLIEKKYGIDVFMFFVDEYMREIYGNKLSILRQEYEAKDGIYPKLIAGDKIIIFSLDKMIHVADIPNDKVEQLKKYSTRSYEYK